MSLVRSLPAFRAGLGIRQLHTSRAVSIRASQQVQQVSRGITPNETAGFEYTPDNAILKGTVNDAVDALPVSKSHGSYHWAFERLLSAALIPLTVSAVVASPTAHPIMDGVLGVSLIVHSHIGFTACIDDYVHERKFPKLAPLCRWLLRFGTAGAVLGIYEFNTEDIGLTELCAKVWQA